ncbi:SDR family oxidoreductase [Agrobacterium leguminum]|uniref:SDR family oxidoreductase n=1 Tax=Agrobacterium leguminum TaxID=2792015 RepID=UPI003CE57918
MKTTGNTILITGGGSGIGEALAHRFHGLGNRVIIAGRRREALMRVAQGRENIHFLEVDMDSPEGIAAFAQEIVARFPGLNVLINNAGIMRTERLDRSRDLTDAEATITTNLLGPIRLTNALIDHLLAQPDAVIVNATSGLAFVPLMSAPTYNASKAALHSYTVSLREALQGRVEVIELVPPAVQTGLTPGQETRPGYQPLGEFIDEVMEQFAIQPTPAEILVKRAHFQRFAEAEGRMDAALATLTGMAKKAFSL